MTQDEIEKCMSLWDAYAQRATRNFGASFEDFVKYSRLMTKAVLMFDINELYKVRKVLMDRLGAEDDS